MRYTYLRLITDYERNMLYDMMQDGDNESGYRAKIILLKNEGYTVTEIRRDDQPSHDVNNIRKWILRFHEQGIKGKVSKIHRHKPVKISDIWRKRL